MGQYTTDRERDARSRAQARGNAWEQSDTGGTLDFTRACECCGRPFTSRKPWARFCCPTCRARASDARTGRTAHVATGKRAGRRLAGRS